MAFRREPACSPGITSHIAKRYPQIHRQHAESHAFGGSCFVKDAPKDLACPGLLLVKVQRTRTIPGLRKGEGISDCRPHIPLQLVGCIWPTPQRLQSSPLGVAKQNGITVLARITKEARQELTPLVFGRETI
jgi:hypothetical protein